MTPAEMRQAIARKRDGSPLEPSLWSAVIAANGRGEVDDAQLAALLMACFFRGLDASEREALTRAFIASGDVLEAPVANCVDKHSSGGVADTTSLVVVPLVAACGVPVAKLSGRALGHTGGTLDKLEAIDGVRTDLTPEAFTAQVRAIGCAIAAATDRLVPADRHVYALRDRTATVESLGLVAASIVSKKIAGGAPSIVYDVKVGSGAFFRRASDATSLADSLVALSGAFGRRAAALVSDMDEPLGTAIGTGLEVLEACAILRGERRVARLSDLCERVALEMLRLGGVTESEAQPMIERVIASGAAYARFEAMVAAQGATRGALERLKPHQRVTHVLARRNGYVAAIDATTLGETARALVERDGPGAGVCLAVAVGGAVAPGRVLATVYGGAEWARAVEAAFVIEAEPPAPRPLVYYEAASGTGSGAARTADTGARSKLETR